MKCVVLIFLYVKWFSLCRYGLSLRKFDLAFQMKCKYANAFIGNRWLKTWQYPLAKEKNDIAGSHRAAVTYTFCEADGKSIHLKL